MRHAAPFLVLGVLLVGDPAFACVQQEVDPCTGRPVGRAAPGQRGPAPADTAPPPPAVEAPEPAAGAAGPAEPAPPAGPPGGPVPGGPPPGVAVPPAARPHPEGEPVPVRIPPTPADAPRAEEHRAALRLAIGRYDRGLRAGPAGSLSVPTALGVSSREAFVGVGFQSRTRYTRDSDGGVVIGVGVGRTGTLAAEVALTSYSTLRGAPYETGGLSVKLHRQVAEDLHAAAGWENLARWGGSDAQSSPYLAATRLFPLRRDPRASLSAAALTLGVGGGRFRSERDDAAGRRTANAFAAAGVRVLEPLSIVADWTGQDLAAGVSLTPIRRVPLVLTVGGLDLTGSAGDGARLVASLGYGLAVPWAP
jgi:hypothetical protein